MLDTRAAVIEFLQRVMDPDENREFTIADQYGEPGYKVEGDLSMVVISDLWCPCGKVIVSEQYAGEPYESKYHRFEYHYPKTFAMLEARGVEFVFYDEWTTIDTQQETPPGSGNWPHVTLAYRTVEDSYHWQSSIIWSDEDGEWLSPHDSLDTWLGWAVNDPRRCLPSIVWSPADLIGAGFEQHNGQFQNGFFEHMNDDPKRIYAAMRSDYGDKAEIVFLLDEHSQFYISFSSWYRLPESDEEAEEFED